MSISNTSVQHTRTISHSSWLKQSNTSQINYYKQGQLFAKLMVMVILPHFNTTFPSSRTLPGDTRWWILEETLIYCKHRLIIHPRRWLKIIVFAASVDFLIPRVQVLQHLKIISKKTTKTYTVNFMYKLHCSGTIWKKRSRKNIQNHFEPCSLAYHQPTAFLSHNFVNL